MSDTDGKIIWFEVASADGGRARGFYGDLFGWQFQPFEDGGDYQMTDGGAVYSDSDEKGILVYFGTSDIDASVAQVRELGGPGRRPAGDPERRPLRDVHRHRGQRVRPLPGLKQRSTAAAGMAAARVGLDPSARPVYGQRLMNRESGGWTPRRRRSGGARRGVLIGLYVSRLPRRKHALVHAARCRPAPRPASTSRSRPSPPSGPSSRRTIPTGSPTSSATERDRGSGRPSGTCPANATRARHDLQLRRRERPAQPVLRPAAGARRARSWSTGSRSRRWRPTTRRTRSPCPRSGSSIPVAPVGDNAKNQCDYAPCALSMAHRTITFTFRTGEPGHYRWQCFVPCAAGFIYGFGGPMQTIGYMDGFLNVG